MVAIGLSAGGVARVRFAISPLWETIASIRVLRDPGAHAIHLPWVRRVRPRLGRLTESELWRLVPPGPAYVPDFLTPAPAGLFAELPAELEALRATPEAEVAAQWPGAAPLDKPLDKSLDKPPDGLLERLATQLGDYFDVALAPDWPRIRRLLEAEVFTRARALAADGVGGLLNDLHEQVRWADDTLSVAQRWCTADDVPDGGGLVLIPSVFVWPSILTVSTGRLAQLAYPPRGTGGLWERPARAPDGVAAVLGRSRARLLVELSAPASTTALAARTGLTAGGVSQHLAALRAAGLVTAHRDGRTVLNIRTDLADALLGTPRNAERRPTR
ncbi:ArsR family transcriptional regulator [Dactylosporangium siamense]|uniref:Transcriptional regulator n=1 Tax=Dactylosporangium siamense TaxID=685454 RepID=A0A919PVC2_9ACTN|nr:helix-turn-helix domain-containing protein [Dactylosporangium siamense]GIG51181.1 transcriptional regulator [Dactylosporangium siamense]